MESPSRPPLPSPSLESLLELRNEPLCGGVIVHERGRMLFAVSTEDMWTAEGTQIKIPIWSVGGGMEAGENMLECAIREAKEEIGADVDIVHAPITFICDEYGNASQMNMNEEPAPICYQRKFRGTSAPFQPGLPEGEVLHVGGYLAHLKNKPTPLDIPAFIWVPTAEMSVLFDGVELRNLLVHNIELVAKSKLPANANLYFPETCTEKMLHDLLVEHGGTLFPDFA